MAKKVVKKNTAKKSLIVNYNKIPNELKLALAKKYPDGYANYVTRYPKPNGEFFYAVSLETDEANYLIKVEVKIDNLISEDDFDKHLGDIGDMDSKSIGEVDVDNSDDDDDDYADDGKEEEDDEEDDDE